MKAALVRLLAWWKLIALPALIKFGLVGAFLVALLDSSSIPVPMDVILAAYFWSAKSKFILYAVMAAFGSAIGGLLPYSLGRAGGEVFLRKRVSAERFAELSHKFERQEFIAVMVPSMLPPPTPWKAFVFAAGVFKMRVWQFMLAVFVGRLLRWILLGILVIKLGPDAVAIVQRHALTALGVVAVAALISLLYLFQKRRGART